MSLEKLTPKQLQLAKAYEDAFVFDAEGNATVPKEHVENNLSEGLDMDTVKRVQAELLMHTNASVLGLGNKSIDLLKANPGLSSTSTKFKIGQDSISASFTRSVNMRNPGTGEAFVRQGVGHGKLLAGANAKNAAYKQIVEDLTERATSAWNQ
jgi:hypothetical protein